VQSTQNTRQRFADLRIALKAREVVIEDGGSDMLGKALRSALTSG
jgi:hypothetical protein